MRYRPAKVVVLGLAVMDLHFVIPEWPDEGRSVQATEFGMFPGGKGLTQAVACAKLGMQTNLVSVVGDDEHGEATLLKLKDEQVGVTLLVPQEARATGTTALLTRFDTGQSAAIGWKNELGLHVDGSRFNEGTMLNLLRHCDFLLVTFEFPRDIVEPAIRAAKRHGPAITIVSPAPPYLAQRFSDLRLIDYLVGNVWELTTFARLHGIRINQQLANDARIEALSCDLIVSGVGNVVVVEDEGCRAFLCRRTDGEAPMQLVASKAHPGGTKSAGDRDAFCAALAYRLHESNQSGVPEVREEIRWATAAMSCARRGTLSIPDSMPTLAEVQEAVRMSGVLITSSEVKE